MLDIYFKNQGKSLGRRMDRTYFAAKINARALDGDPLALAVKERMLRGEFASVNEAAIAAKVRRPVKQFPTDDPEGAARAILRAYSVEDAEQIACMILDAIDPDTP